MTVEIILTVTIMGIMAEDMPKPGENSKKYYFVSGGDGFGPHSLQNVDDPKDVLYLCACGGTQDPNGICDNTHEKKPKNGCCCWYCKPRADRVGKEFDGKHCTKCE
jgi:hypothetical protein